MRKYTYFLYLLLICLFFSAADCRAKNAPEYQELINESQLYAKDIKRHFEEDRLIELMAGTDPFTVIQHEEETPFLRGTAILISDWSSHSAQSQSLSLLNQSLTKYGWLTLSVSGPDSYYVASMESDEQKRYISNPHLGMLNLPMQAKKQYQQALMLQMKAIEGEVEKRPGISMIVAQGTQAALLIEMMSDDTIFKPEILVIVQPYLPDTQLNKQLVKKMAELDIAILDIWSDYDNPWALHTVEYRRMQARKMLTMHYRQRELFGDLGWEPRDARLTKEIVGYVSYLGW